MLEALPSVSQNLAFGEREKLFTSANGKFVEYLSFLQVEIKFVEYLALFDSVMHEYLRNVHDKETCIHYLGKDIHSTVDNHSSVWGNRKRKWMWNKIKLCGVLLYK